MELYIGADHKGFYLKEHLKPWLKSQKINAVDLGALTLDPKDDYTKYASKVALSVREDKTSKGILLCGSGVGVDIVANKFDGIRSSIGKSADQVKEGRKDDDMNILVIASDFTSLKEAKDMITTFLKTKFDKLPRHQKRLKDIKKIEESN